MTDELSGDVFGRHEDQVGEFQLAEPPRVQPVEFVAVERAVAEVEAEEVGRDLGLAVEHRALLADVAVDHAQDGRDAQLPAPRG